LEKKKRGIQCNTRGVTEPKAVEQAMVGLETRYQRLFESANDGIVILNAETGKVIDVNPIMIDMMGQSKEYFTDKAFWEIEFFKDIADTRRKYLKFKLKKNVRYKDLLLKANDRREINIEFVSDVYEVNNVDVIQCNIRDITQRKKEENEAIHAGRVLKVNNEINHAIINIHHKKILLEKICKIASLHGKYRMAWIVMVDEEDSVLKTGTWSGFEDGFIADVTKYFLDDH